MTKALEWIAFGGLILTFIVFIAAEYHRGKNNDGN